MQGTLKKCLDFLKSAFSTFYYEVTKYPEL